MSEPRIYRPSPLVRRLTGPLANRPRLLGAIALGVVTAVALWLVPNGLSWSTRAIFAWDATALWFIAASMLMMADCDQSKIEARSATEDDGGHFVLGLAIIAAAASIAAIVAELGLAEHEHGLLKGARVALAFVTVAASWFFVQIVFALHYAHEYYGRQEGEPDFDGGLLFPGDDAPDYWDFLHFSTVIGVASQTADIQFTSKTLRRIGTVHGIVAFLFNTVVLALTINLCASLF